MNRSVLFSFILLIIFSSCNSYKENNYKENFNLSETIKNIISGKDTTNSSLMIIRDYELPVADNPNQIRIDTVKVGGKKLYAVLAEYPNPIYNRFAIIDSDLNVLLLDKSLNGNLKEVPLKINTAQFIQVDENFISNGALRIKRISLYSIDPKGEAEFAFRTYTQLSDSEITYTQEISQIDSSEIKTKIISSVPAKLKLKKDTDEFFYDQETKQYRNETNVFDSLVLSEVKNFKFRTDQPQIVSRDSLLKQMGIIHSDKKTERHVGNFSMPLSDEWNEIKNVKMSLMLKKIISGTKYVNNHYGAEISVIQLPENDSSENYISYPLENVSSGNYRVRFSEKISDGKYFYQFFEYSCNSEKFLLILQTLKSTYKSYKPDYQNLINSFSIEC